jgi:pimeloyl-ACP methyl ester carboxylesterase
MARAISFLILLCALAAMARPVRAEADDPFTPAGASRIDVKVGTATGFVFKPTAGSTHADQPWLWYAPTLLSLPNGQYPNVRTHWLFTKLLARGIWIAGVDVGESYGAPAGRSIYSEFYKDVISQFHLSRRPCFLAQSRGGLMSFDWAEENSDDVRCIAAIYPVLSLASWPPEGSPLFLQAATAYGYTSQPEFQKQLIQLSPLSHAGPLAKANIPIFILHGDSDHTVPMQENSQPFVTAYRAQGGTVELVIVPGKGHEEVDEYFKSDRLLDFLLNHLNKPTIP